MSGRLIRLFLVDPIYLKKVLSTALMPTSVIVVPSGKVSKVLLAVGCAYVAMT